MGLEEQLRELLRQFLDIHGVRDVVIEPIILEFQAAPHAPPRPLRNERAVYLFFQNDVWLRIGQTGYSPRFTSQHYGTRRAGSTFAADIWANRVEFGFDGDESQIGPWLLQNFGRANVRLPDNGRDAVSRLLEAFLHLHLNPRFEGAR